MAGSGDYVRCVGGDAGRKAAVAHSTSGAVSLPERRHSLASPSLI